MPSSNDLFSVRAMVLGVIVIVLVSVVGQILLAEQGVQSPTVLGDIIKVGLGAMAGVLSVRAATPKDGQDPPPVA